MFNSAVCCTILTRVMERTLAEYIPTIKENDNDVIFHSYRLLDDEDIDEIIIMTSDSVIMFHVYITSIFRRSEYRYTAVCKLYWKDKEICEWQDRNMSELISALPKRFNEYLYAQPVLKRDDRLETWEFRKKRMDENRVVEWDGEQVIVETDKEAHAHHEGDTDISPDCKTVLKLDKAPEFIALVDARDTKPIVSFKRKGKTLITLRKDTIKDIKTALVYAIGQPACIEGPIFDDTLCFHPMCRKPYTVQYIVKDRHDARRHELKRLCASILHFRRFCDDHKRRGERDLDDGDTNYIIHNPE